MDEASIRPIAVLQGASSLTIQALLRAFAASLPPGVRVAGVVEEPLGDPAGGDARLLSLTDGRTYPVFQDLGPSSSACAVDAESIVTACEDIRREIAKGCDLVLLSKFGRLEAERSGLADAFAAAVEAQVPILTSVAPKFAAPWAAFAEPLFVTLPPVPAAIHRWWRGVALPAEEAACA